MSKTNTFILAGLLLFSGWQAHAQRLSLEDALAYAQNHNPELQAAQLEIEKVSQERTIARSLFLPTIGIQAQANHYFQVPAFFGLGETGESGKIPYGRFGGADQLSTSIFALQPLFNPVASPTLQRSRIQHERSIVEARMKQIEILSNIKLKYLEIAVLDKRIKLTEESIKRNNKVLQDSKSLFIQGKGLRVDTLRAYTSVRNLEPEFTKLTYAAETARLQLKELIGSESFDDVIVADSMTVSLDPVTEDENLIVADVLSHNPEYQILKLQEQLDQQQTRLASSLRLPVLSLVGQYQLQSQTEDLDYGNAYYPASSFVGLQFSVPLFTGFRTTATHRQSRITEKQSSLLLQHKERQLRTRVHQVLADIREAALRVDNTAVVQETAKVSYDIIQYRYKNGISSRIELTDAELALSTAQSNYLEAVFDYVAATIELNKLKGSLD